MNVYDKDRQLEIAVFRSVELSSLRMVVAATETYRKVALLYKYF